VEPVLAFNTRRASPQHQLAVVRAGDHVSYFTQMGGSLAQLHFRAGMRRAGDARGTRKAGRRVGRPRQLLVDLIRRPSTAASISFVYALFWSRRECCRILP